MSHVTTHSGLANGSFFRFIRSFDEVPFSAIKNHRRDSFIPCSLAYKGLTLFFTTNALCFISETLGRVWWVLFGWELNDLLYKARERICISMETERLHVQLDIKLRHKPGCKTLHTNGYGTRSSNRDWGAKLRTESRGTLIMNTLSTVNFDLRR